MKKRSLITILIVVLTSMYVFARDYTYNNINYDIVNDYTVSAIVSTTSDDGEIISGKCGSNVYYVYNKTTHSLTISTISGEGQIDSYYPNDSEYAPWYQYAGDIHSLYIESGVTSIGNWAFSECSNLTSVTIPNSVTYIGKWAFCGCSSLTTMTIPNSVEQINWMAFFRCI